MAGDKNGSGGGRGKGRPYQKGESGNPSGRPRGSKNLNKLLLEKIEERSEEIIEVLIERALKGDNGAMKIISDRVMPVPKGVLVDFELPERLPDGSLDMVRVQESLLEAVASGQITPNDAASISIIFDRIMAAKNETFFHDQVLDAVDRVQNIEKLIK